MQEELDAAKEEEDINIFIDNKLIYLRVTLIRIIKIVKEVRNYAFIYILRFKDSSLVESRL